MTDMRDEIARTLAEWTEDGPAEAWLVEVYEDAADALMPLIRRVREEARGEVRALIAETAIALQHTREEVRERILAGQAHAPTDDERPTLDLARSIASWDQGVEATNRIPHWAVNLAMHLRELGFPIDDEREGWRAEAERVRKAAWAEIHGQDPQRTYSVAEVKRIVYPFDNVLSGLLSRRTVQGEPCSCRGEYLTALDLVDGCKCGRIKPFDQMTDDECNEAAAVQGKPSGHDGHEFCDARLGCVQGEPSDEAVRAALRQWFRGMLAGGWGEAHEDRMRATLHAAAAVEGGAQRCICTPAIAGISDGPNVECPQHGEGS